MSFGFSGCTHEATEEERWEAPWMAAELFFFPSGASFILLVFLQCLISRSLWQGNRVSKLRARERPRRTTMVFSSSSPFRALLSRPENRSSPLPPLQKKKHFLLFHLFFYSHKGLCSQKDIIAPLWNVILKIDKLQPSQIILLYIPIYDIFKKFFWVWILDNVIFKTFKQIIFFIFQKIIFWHI